MLFPLTRKAVKSRLKGIGPTLSWRLRRPHLSTTQQNAGIRREPELPEHEEIALESRKTINEVEPIDEDADDEPQRRRMMQRTMGAVARQISLDSGDDMQM